MSSKIPRPIPKPTEKPKTDDEKLTERYHIPHRATSHIQKNENEKAKLTRTLVSGKNIEKITDIKCSTNTEMVSRSQKGKSLKVKTLTLPVKNEAKTSKDIKAKAIVPEVTAEKKESSTVKEKFKTPVSYSGAENVTKKFSDKKIICTKQTSIVNTEKAALDKSSLAPRRNVLHGGIKFIPTKKRKAIMFDFNAKSKESQETSDDDKDKNS